MWHGTKTPSGPQPWLLPDPFTSCWASGDGFRAQCRAGKDPLGGLRVLALCQSRVGRLMDRKLPSFFLTFPPGSGQVCV